MSPALDHSAINAIVARLAPDKAAMEAIAWQEAIRGPRDDEPMLREAIWVICCSGMKFAVAKLIQERVWSALNAGQPVIDRFRNKGKAAAIENIWKDRQNYFDAYLSSDNKLEFLATLPWIGPITKYHLGKNLGLDVAKPDVHLQRLADRAGQSVQGLCEALAKKTGYRVATVDLILWWACAHGILNSRTGEMSA